MIEFNLERALRGDALIDRDGGDVTGFQSRVRNCGTDYPYQSLHDDVPARIYTAKGKYFAYGYRYSERDLFMKYEEGQSQATENIDELSKITARVKEIAIQQHGDQKQTETVFSDLWIIEQSYIGISAANNDVHALWEEAKLTIKDQADKIAELEATELDEVKQLEQDLSDANSKIESFEALFTDSGGCSMWEGGVASFCVQLGRQTIEMKRQGFWLGFEDARCHPDKMNILEQWQNTKTFKQTSDLVKEAV